MPLVMRHIRSRDNILRGIGLSDVRVSSAMPKASTHAYMVAEGLGLIGLLGFLGLLGLIGFMGLTGLRR